MKLIYASALFYSIVLCCLPFWSFSQTGSNYCVSKGTRTNVWINKISIGNWSHQSGNNNGYLHKTDAQLVLRQGIFYPLQLELGGTPRVQDTLYWQTWVDANGDGDFEDADERIFQAKTLQRAQPKGNIVIPYYALNGQLRLRLVLSKTGFVGPCEQGSKVLEVEDYDFPLESLPSCSALAPQNIHIEAITDSNARIIVKRPASISYHLEVRDEYGAVVQLFEYLLYDTVLVRGLKVRNTYTATVQLQCYQDVFSPWSEPAVFKTPFPICDNPNVENISIHSLDGGKYAFSTDLSAAGYFWRFRLKGEQSWLYFSNLEKDTLGFEFYDREMEAQLSVLCQNGVQSDWSASKNFRTEPLHCAGPIFDSIRVQRSIYLQRTEFSYPRYGTQYQWRVRVVGGATWKEYTTHQSFFYVDTLLAESFEVQLRWECEKDQWSDWSKSIVLAASNCPQVRPAATSHFSYFFAAYPSFQISWISAAPTVESKASYRWSSREKGQEIWSEPLKTTEPSAVLSGMTPGKTYEIRMEVTCMQDSSNSFSVIETKSLPLSCVEIDESQINLYRSTQGVFVEVDFDESVPIQLRFAQKDSTKYDTLISLGGWLRSFNNLPPDTEYEISVRGYCFDGTEMPWSEPLYFKTLSCELPNYGIIDMVQFGPQDSIVFEANFERINVNPKDTVSWAYHWQYRVRDGLSWTKIAASKGNFRKLVLQGLMADTNYELQLVTHCVQNPLDSFILRHYFSTDPLMCGAKPDISLMHIQPEPNQGYSKVKCDVPSTHLWEARIFQKEGNRWVSRDFRRRLPDTYMTLLNNDNAFQFRIICPNQSVSPWSDTIYMADYVKRWQPSYLAKIAAPSTNLRIAPNPSNSQFNILLPAEIPTDQQKGWLEVYNVAGQKVLSRKTPVNAGDVLTLDLSNQSTGMYLLRLKIGQKVFTERLLLSKGQ